MTTESFFVAGVDIGAATAKSVILNENEIIASYVMPTGHSVEKAAEAVMQKSLEKKNLSMTRIRHVISTGYGRRAVPFADDAVTEISCHAKGVHALIAGARTVIDVGGQDSKVIEIDDNGSIGNFVMNDKCAAGTGRFLEVMAKVLNTDIEDIGTISLQGHEPCQISNTCTVFAESEMVTLRAEGKSRENLFSGIHAAMAHRIAIMGHSVGFRKQIVFTGGVAKNVGMKKALEDKIGMKIIVPEEPQIVGALGAAILARNRIKIQ
ncbi:MAG: 2-hydroxyglutaryl-CoA dehydratase [Deltaproteobacteria bacterium]|nr:2-hydroxyglutaryl-CoA dehydratase [Deltaproteobacteria bacterium]